jgi:hypothetical protein
MELCDEFVEEVALERVRRVCGLPTNELIVLYEGCDWKVLKRGEASSCVLCECADRMAVGEWAGNGLRCGIRAYSTIGADMVETEVRERKGERSPGARRRGLVR